MLSASSLCWATVAQVCPLLQLANNNDASCSRNTRTSSIIETLDHYVDVQSVSTVNLYNHIQCNDNVRWYTSAQYAIRKYHTKLSYINSNMMDLPHYKTQHNNEILRTMKHNELLQTQAFIHTVAIYLCELREKGECWE
ncbi:hypothetical protein K492DRAFT_180436 [Lichtheimia hyalospora FSU 10163]|nr:hypothetical protein K492DRAFT_180436 [Lichtheimia hyalospora FSU 10163]